MHRREGYSIPKPPGQFEWLGIAPSHPAKTVQFWRKTFLKKINHTPKLKPMVKYATIRTKQGKIYFDCFGNKFVPFSEGLMNAVNTVNPVIEYNTEKSTFITLDDEVAPEEQIEVQVECFIIQKAFNSSDELLLFKRKEIIDAFLEKEHNEMLEEYESKAEQRGWD
jgi:hypothetical protein